MIRVDLRAKSYGPTPVLGQMRFTLTQGETLAVLGPSGIGKSTLLRIVAGLDTAFEGTVDAPAKRAFVFQEPTLLPWRSVLQNLTLIHPDLGRRAAEDWLTRTGLGGKGALFPGQLSLGQQRRLSLARAFAGAPDLLLLDEPFVSLDPDTAETMIALTENLIRAEQPATLFVTHDRREADRLASRTLTLRASASGAVPA